MFKIDRLVDGNHLTGCWQSIYGLYTICKWIIVKILWYCYLIECYLFIYNGFVRVAVARPKSTIVGFIWSPKSHYGMSLHHLLTTSAPMSPNKSQKRKHFPCLSPHWLWWLWNWDHTKNAFQWFAYSVHSLT